MTEAEIPGDRHGGNVWQLAERLGVPLEEVLDFSANINPLGPPKGVRGALKKALSQVIHYPEPTYERLRKAICRYLNAPGNTPLHILLGNGSSELLHFIPSFLKPRCIAFPAPAFSEYERSARAAGAKALKIMGNPEDGFSPREEELARAARVAELLFLANPQNPQGMLLRAELLELALREAGRSGCWVVLDEAFMDFLPEPSSQSLVEMAYLGKKVLVVRSFTKIFALPGLRLGYVVGPEMLIQGMIGRRPPWAVNSLAQAAALAAVEDGDYLLRTRRLMERERQFLAKGLRAIEGLFPYPSQANYLLVELSSFVPSASTLAGRLASKGILIRDLSCMEGLGSRFFRLAVRSRRENERLLRELEGALNEGELP